LPACNEHDLSFLDWSGLAGVYTDYSIEHPALNSVHPDHYRAMMMLLRHLRMLGYQKPGLFVAPHVDERILYRWQAAYLAFQANPGGFTDAVPTLKAAGMDASEFTRWFKKYSPDVVLGHQTEAIDWMVAAGANVPGNHGFVCLDLLMKDRPCAGLDLQPHLVGSLALEQVAAQIHRNEFGIPTVPLATAIAARWNDGPTVQRVAPCARDEVSESGAVVESSEAVVPDSAI
jgi:LacI family transcriptional regulator